MNNIQELNQIIADAPDGATHFALGMHYLALNGSNNWMRYDRNGFKNAKWFVADDFKFSYVKSFHSLSDLLTMVEQYEENQQLKTKVAELEQQVEFEMGQKAKAREQRDKVTKSLPIRDLEQQARGVEDALQYFSFNKDILFGDLVMVESICYTKDLQARAETLRNQAKGGDV